ncbi:hypothetical protein L3Y34_005195 [Caenorhabditis briggsae]|uniref:Uncharacterized protein n=1 Tax=Caenorhabditis briggsae TaxID=6238 RepID=A0AAE9AE39_CAEBR|nr:hypothetical protein L3Y34_005195 [Caenorhabditis briggsae]
MSRGRQRPTPPNLLIMAVEIPLLIMYVLYINQYSKDLPNGWSPVLIAGKCVLVAWQYSIHQKIAEGRYRHTSSAIFYLELLFILRIITGALDIFWNRNLSKMNPQYYKYGLMYVCQYLVFNIKQFYAMYQYVHELEGYNVPRRQR